MILLLLNPLTALVLGLACGYFLSEKVVSALTVLAGLGAVYAGTHMLPEMAGLITLAITVDLVVFAVVMLLTASIANRWWSKVDFSGLFRQS